MTLGVSLLLLVVVASSAHGQNCDVSVIDAPGNRLVGGNITDYALPTTRDEYQQWCQDLKNATRQMNIYFVQCLEVHARTVAVKVIDSSYGQVKHFCQQLQQSGEPEFLNHVQCIAASRQGVTQCMTKYMTDAETIARTVDTKDILPYYCCSFNALPACIPTTLHQSCKKEDADWLQNQMERMFTPLLFNECLTNKYDCKSLKPLQGATPTKWKSTMTSLIILLDRIYQDHADD